MQASFNKNHEPIYNAFIRDFSRNKETAYGTHHGKIDGIVGKIFVSSFGDVNSFNSQVKAHLPRRLQNKAVALADKYYKLHQISQLAGGDRFYNSQETQGLRSCYKNYLEGKATKEELFKTIDFLPTKGPIKAEIKRFVTANSRIAHPIVTAQTGRAEQFKLDGAGVQALYANKQILRNDTSHATLCNPGGAVNIGYEIYKQNPNAKIGIMIAANSGLPGGAMSNRMPYEVNPGDINMTTQEESIWANVILSACGPNQANQEAYFEDTIKDQWGLREKGKNSTDTHTLQGVDFTTTQNPEDYNGSFTLKNCAVTAMSSEKVIGPKTGKFRNKNTLIQGESFPVVLSFADSINANSKIGTAQGSMRRTLNQRAAEGDYDFFRECIKTKLRSSLDGMAKEEVTHPLVAKLSCGIYAGPHQHKVADDFDFILEEVLEEAVGPNGEPRGCYFEAVNIAAV